MQATAICCDEGDIGVTRRRHAFETIHCSRHQEARRLPMAVFHDNGLNVNISDSKDNTSGGIEQVARPEQYEDSQFCALHVMHWSKQMLWI
jgi:hypothetical protein